MLHIAFRTDASSQIGTGHFMRCLTLADALRQRGAKIRFVSRELPMHLQDMLAGNNIEFSAIERPENPLPVDDLAHAKWLGLSQLEDAHATSEALSGRSWDWLIVDHYGLDARWESALRQTARKIMVIDDIADRHHDCDVLLDQNFYSDIDTRYIGKVPLDCRVLLGPRYALLRDGFRQLRERIILRTGPVRRVLVFFGGVDRDNYTGQVVESLAGNAIEGLHVDVVMGAQHPHLEQVMAACKKYHFEFHVQTGRMAELMAAADIAIGAGGSAIWERCCLGLPTFGISTADNQVRQVADAACEGLLYAPELSGDLMHSIGRHIKALCENSYLRQAMSKRAMAAVDGRGILRVISILGCSGMNIRTAHTDDSAQLFAWRNHHAIRAVSRNPERINLNVHERWFAAVLSSTDKHLLIGIRDETPIGVVRFETQGDTAEVSIYVDPDMKDFGLGHELLQSAELWLLRNHPGVGEVRAQVLRDNEPSKRLFSGSGYQVESTTYSKRLQ